jgi:hypothetical protein
VERWVTVSSEETPMRLRIALVIVMLWVIATVPAAAGVRLITGDRSGPAGYRSELSLDGKAARIDLPEPRVTILFRKDRQVAWVVNHAEKTYVEISRSDVQEIAGRLAQARAMLEEKIEYLSSPQREMMEEMLNRQLPGLGTTADPDYSKVESRVRLRGWNCDHYEGTRDGEKVADVWTVNPRELGLGPEDVAVLSDLGEFLEGLADRVGASMATLLLDRPDGGGIDGIPVRYVGYTGRSIHVEQEVLELTPMTFDASFFELPAGLTREEAFEGRH